MTDKPYYVIDFLATNCFVDIRVNDVSVFCLNVEGQIGTNIRVNYAILKQGWQFVNYIVLPMVGETSFRNSAEFSAKLCLYDASGNYIEKIKEIDTYKTPEKTTTPVPVYKHEATFLAEVPYSIDKSWQNSMDLNKIDGLRELVDNAYKRIETIFNVRNYDQFINLIEQKENNFAKSMYLNDQMKGERIRDMLKVLQESDYKVVPTLPLDIMLVHAYGKLVTLKKPDGFSAFILRNSAGQEMHIELKFHLEQGKTALSII